MSTTKPLFNRKGIGKYIGLFLFVSIIASVFYYTRFYRDSDAIAEYKIYIGRASAMEHFRYADLFRDNVTRFQYEYWDKYEETYQLSNYLIIEGLAKIDFRDSVWVTIDDSKNKYISFGHKRIWYPFKESISDKYAEYMAF